MCRSPGGADNVGSAGSSPAVVVVVDCARTAACLALSSTFVVIGERDVADGGWRVLLAAAAAASAAAAFLRMRLLLLLLLLCLAASGCVLARATGS